MARDAIGPGEGEEAPSGDELRLELVIEPGEGLGGSLAATDGRRLAFSGWLGLAGAIDTLREGFGKTSHAT